MYVAVLFVQACLKVVVVVGPPTRVTLLVSGVWLCLPLELRLGQLPPPCLAPHAPTPHPRTAQVCLTHCTWLDGTTKLLLLYQVWCLLSTHSWSHALFGLKVCNYLKVYVL